VGSSPKLVNRRSVSAGSFVIYSRWQIVCAHQHVRYSKVGLCLTIQKVN
jgi:hypothetical protein